MSATEPLPAQDELRLLERDRERIDAQLRGAISPFIDELLRGERRWVMRRQRAIERVPVRSEATLHFRALTEACLVRDISPHGAGVDMPGQQPRVGDEVCLVLAELPGAPSLIGVVRHVTECRVGLEFVTRSDAVRATAEELGRRCGIGKE